MEDDLAQARGLPVGVRPIRSGLRCPLRYAHDRGAPEGPAIVRNRLKLESAVNNARRILEVQGEFGTFDAYIWQFVNGAPIVGHRHTASDLPSETRESKAMSDDLKRRGFRFVGSTVCYAYMQAAGLVNDHVTTCFRYRELLT